MVRVIEYLGDGEVRAGGLFLGQGGNCIHPGLDGAGGVGRHRDGNRVGVPQVIRGDLANQPHQLYRAVKLSGLRLEVFHTFGLVSAQGQEIAHTEV